MANCRKSKPFCARLTKTSYCGGDVLGNNATGDLNRSRSQPSLSHTLCNTRVQGKSVKGGMGELGNGPGWLREIWEEQCGDNHSRWDS